MTTLQVTRPTLLMVAALVLAACGGGGGGDGAPSQSPTSAPAPTPAPAPQQPPPNTYPIMMTPKQGDFLEFAWQTEQENFAQPNSTTTKSAAGRFKLTFGASVLIQGQQAFPLTLSGDAGSFAPRWTHLAVATDGSLLGSRDGAGLTKIYNAVHAGAWTNGGTFVDFGQSAVTASFGPFVGDYNEVSAIAVGRSFEDARCEEILGEQVCDDDATRFREREYYKQGIGPIGYSQHIYHETDSGGFFTSTAIDKTVELIESSFAATDGTVFVRPPWDEMPPMLTPRSGHAAVAYSGTIWVLGGLDASNRLLASTEIFDPVTSKWKAGPPLPVAMSDISVVAVGPGLVVMKDNDEFFLLTGGSWVARPPPANSSPVLVDATYYRDPTLGDMLVGASRVSQLDQPLIHIGAYDVSENRWYFGGTSQRWRELLRPTVELVGSSLFVIGGFGTSGSVLGERGSLDTIMEFDMTTERWIATGAGAMLIARDNPASAVRNGKIYVFGGNEVTCDLLDCKAGPALRDAEVFDPAAHQSTRVKPMLYPRSNAEAVTLNGLIYVIGGRSNGVSLATVERLTPQ